MSSNVKNRIQELNNRLAGTLTEKGIDANGQETTTELIEKVRQFQPSKIPDGYIKPEGSMDITENGTFDVREKAEVNVQVAAKPEKPFIDSSKMKYFGYMFSQTYGTDLSLLENLDTSKGTDFEYMFQGRTDLTESPLLDTSNGTNFSSMFSGCTGLTGEIGLDTSNGTNFSYMFSGCTNLQKITRLDTSKAVTLAQLFANTVALESVPLIDTANCISLNSAFNQNQGNLIEITLTDTSKCENWNNAFRKASHLVSIKSTLTINDGTFLSGMFYGCYALKNVTFDYIDIRNNSFSVQYSPLSKESLASLVNALSDNSGLNKTYTVTLGSNNLAKLTDEQLAIARNKNILLQ